MTFEKIMTDLSSGRISPKEAYDIMSEKDKMKKINYYCHYNNLSKDPLNEVGLQELDMIVNILQTLYNSDEGSPISDSDFDSLQELLIDMGIPRLSGGVEINSSDKIHHSYTQLRGTLDKVYYLTTDEKRTNKSRKYLDEWITKTEKLYEANTGKKIDLNEVKIICQNKFDGTSVIMEHGPSPVWLTRGDTANNLASDVTHVMSEFNDKFNDGRSGGSKFEAMISEDDKDRINELYREHPYHNSRQIATSIINSNETDFKTAYLYPVPLRIIHGDELVEHIHPILIEKFPTLICTFSDRELIREFANKHRYVHVDGKRFRTDGVVLTILDDNIKIALGRSNNINNFEVAYKFTEEYAYTKVKDIEFPISDFGYITPRLVINPIVLKGNRIQRISLSNKERFDELNFSYGDDVKILYDIIPYATIDSNCNRVPNGRKIEFIKECPRCHSPLNLDRVQVKCSNPGCPSRIVGRMKNYCDNLRIQNIGYKTLDILYTVGIIGGIRDLYRLKKNRSDIENLEGFGKTKTRKIIKEIEAKRELNDYDFFGSIGIDKLSIKTFKDIFSNIRLVDFINMMKNKNFDLMKEKLNNIQGIGDIKSDILIDYLRDDFNRKEVQSILKEVTLIETFSSNRNTNGKVVFSGCRANQSITNGLMKYGYESSDSWTNSAKALIVPTLEYSSSKVDKAKALNIPIITYSDLEKRLIL